MDEDFYIEDHSTLKTIVIIIIFIVIIVGGIYYYNVVYKPNYLKLNTIEIELGDKISKDINDYIVCNDSSLYSLDISNVKVDEEGKTTSVGEYSYKITGNNIMKKGKIKIKDTTKPIVSTKTLTVGVNEEFNISEFVDVCTDLSLPCKVNYEKESSNDLVKSAGEYTINIVVSDMYDNEVVKEVKLIVKDNYSYKEQKEKDLEYVSTSNDEANWNHTYTHKFSKALDVESEELDEKIKEISLEEYNIDKNIIDKEIIVIYNKYGYAIGTSVKLTFDDGSYLFALEDNIKKKED